MTPAKQTTFAVLGVMNTIWHASDTVLHLFLQQLIDSDRNVSDLVVTRNCCMVGVLPGEAGLVLE